MSIFTREMACQELVELVTSYFDGSLSRSDRRRFRAHISGCDALHAPTSSRCAW